MPFIGVRDVFDFLFLVDNPEGIVVVLQQRDRPPTLHLLIDLVSGDGAPPSDNTEHRYGVPEAQRRHLARTSQQPGVAEYGHRTYAAEESAGADRNGLGFATYRYVVDLVIFGNAANEGVDPVIRQAGSQPHAGFDKLRVDLIVDVHMGCFFRTGLLGEVMRSVLRRVKQRLDAIAILATPHRCPKLSARGSSAPVLHGQTSPPARALNLSAAQSRPRAAFAEHR